MSDKKFSIYRASAGTGKTYTLVKIFLKLILTNPLSYSKILAITFTNKAAAEMKDRILNNLRGISEDNSNYQSMVDDLMNDLQLSKDEIQKKAKIVLTNIIHDYSSFNISTIDSFTSKIVKTFSRELGFQPDFEIELDSSSFIEKAIDLIIAKAGTDHSITTALIDFVEKKLEDEKSFNIKKDLNEFGEQIWKENGINAQEKIKDIDIKHFIEVKKNINQETKTLKNSIQTEARAIVERINIEGFSDKLFQGDRGIYGYFKKRAELSKNDAPNSFVHKTIYEDNWQNNTDKKNHPLPDSLKEAIITAFNNIESDLSLYKVYLLILKELYSVSLLNEINKTVNEIYNETGKVALAEFNKRISKIIKEEPIPYIYEKVGTKYEHYFIDEFQDTSDLQWENLSPLIQESLSKGGFNMIVGDGKQAIYRFRNGNVELFEHLSNIGQDLEIFKTDPFYHQAVTKSLSTNFRSEKNIVEFNNQLIEFAINFVQENCTSKNPQLLKNVYTNHSLIANKTEEGLVKVKFFTVDKDEDETLADIYFEEILDTINDVTNKGYQLGDIAILCRTKAQLIAISDFLVANNFSISSAESLLLRNSPEINLLVALIRYLADKESIVDKLFITQWVLKQKNIQENYHEILNKIKESNVNQFQLFLKENGFSVDFQQLSGMPFMDIITDFILDFQLDISNIYMRFFVDALMTRNKSEQLSIFNFQEWWSEKEETLSLSISDTSSSVQMMTIHKSKGLEFPIVILPIYKDSKFNSAAKTWIDPNEYIDSKIIDLPSTLISLGKEATSNTPLEELYQEEEERKHLDLINVLYVTCTRAKKALYVFCEKYESKESNKEKTIHLSNIFNDFLKGKTDDSDEFIMGELLKNTTVKQDIKKVCSEKKEPFSFTPWFKKVAVTHKKSINQSFFENEYTQYGKLIHSLLERIITKDDIPSSVNQLIQSGVISQNEKTFFLNRLTQIVEHQQLQPFFSSKITVLNENDILLPNSSSSLRPDRIVIMDNKTTILDYKTGVEKKEHSEQMQNYAKILTEMGYEIADVFLVYIENEDILVKNVDL